MTMPKNQKRKNENSLETRVLNFKELRTDKENKTIEGHAAVFNIITDLGWFREQVIPGAFKNTIKNDDIRALFNHDANYILGRNISKTLELEEDEVGLRIKIYPGDTTYTRDLMISIDRGDISQMSFSFNSILTEWLTEENQPDLRTLKEVKLYDVSPVTFAAYPDTDVALRSHEQWQESLPKDEFIRTSLLKKQIHLLEIN